MLHLLIVSIFVFLVFQTTSASLWIVYLTKRGSEEGTLLFEVQFFFAIVGYLPLAIGLSLMIKMWANVLFSWQFSTDSKKKSIASWILDVILLGINGIILLDVIALIVFISLLSRFPSISHIYIDLISPGIFAVVQAFLVVVAVVLGIMVIRALKLSPNSGKKLVLQKIGIAIIGFILSTLIRFGGAVLPAVMTRPEWPIILFLRQLPDVLLTSVILVVFFPFNLACSCCNARISRLLQPIIMNDEDSETSTTPRSDRKGTVKALASPELSSASPTTPVTAALESNPII